MGSNLGNLFNEIIILVRGRYGVLHVIMNSTGVGVGYRDRTANSARWRGRDDTGESGVGRVRQCMLEDTEREGFGKRFHLVGNVGGLRGRL